MTLSRRFWFAIHPDISRPIGGVKQIHRLAEAIVQAGHEAILIQDNADFHPGWFNSKVNTISLKNWLQLSDLNPRYDVLVLPETFIPSLNTFRSNLPIIIFNQNGSYSFGFDSSRGKIRPGKILDIYASRAISHVFCVSRHDFKLLTTGFGLPDSKVSLITNGIEESLFYPVNFKKKQIAYMPRKNSVDSRIVCSMLSRKLWLDGWSLKPITGCSQTQVSSILQESLLFLSFGHPEGFGLPVAEALASGCGVVGYSGLGGRELFSIAKSHHVAKEIGLGDWVGFVDAIQQFVEGFNTKPDWLVSCLRSCSQSVRNTYCQEAMLSSVVNALNKFESSV